MAIVGTIRTLLHFLIPETEHVERLLKTDTGTLRKILPGAERETDGNTFAVFDYRNKDVKTLVKTIKFKDHPELLERAAVFLHEEILEIALDRMLFENKTRIALIPIPMNREDERARGWNQSLELCNAVVRLNKMQNNSEIFVADILRKVKRTEHQRNLSRNNRLTNLENSIERVGELPPDSLPIIIDDVTTTGATLNEARRALGLPYCLAITLAH